MSSEKKVNDEFIPLSRGIIPTPKPQCRVSEDEDGLFLYGVDDNKLCRLNHISLLLWRLCNGRNTAGEIVDFLNDRYPGGEDTISRDVKTTLLYFLNSNAIVFSGRPAGSDDNWREIALARKTFHANRGKVATAVLKEWGWLESDPDDVAGLALWNHGFKNPRCGIIETFEGQETRQLDEKDLLFKNLKQRGIEHLLPETYLTFEDFDQNATFRDGDLWYVKIAESAMGDGVYCLDNKAEIEGLMRKKRSGRPIVQKCVDDLYLLDGRNFTLRVYALILADLSIHVYEECLFIIQPRAYEKSVLDPDIHVRHQTWNRASSDDYTFFGSLFPGICNTLKLVVESVEDQINFAKEPNRYQILGCDFVVTADLEPRLIEMNDWPSLGISGRKNKNVSYEVKKRVLTDFFEMLFRDKRGRFVSMGG